MLPSTRRKKGNIKKMPSLQCIAPINYNEGSNDDIEEVIEEERFTSFQYTTKIPNVSAYGKKSSTTPKRLSSPDPSPSSSQPPSPLKKL
jgi:hypothetical protein